MLRGDVLQLTGLDIKQEGRMNEFLKNGSYSEYAQRNGLAVKDFGRHNGMAGRKKGSFGSSQRNAIADSVEEQQENSFDPRKYSKASSYRKSRHTHDKLSCALGDYGAVSGGIEKNAADLIPDVYDEIFRLPPKMSSSSKFSELPVLDPSAYYDEEDLFSTTTVIRNSSAGVIYEDIFGGGLASGPTYTDLSDLLEYFGVSNSRSQTSSSSGLYVESPIPVSDSFRGEPDDNGHFRSNDSSKLEFSGKYPTPLQSRSVNSFSQTDVGEEPYIGLPREHAGHRNKRGSRRFSKNGEVQKEITNDVVQQASKAPTYTEKSFPLATDADPVSTVQSSCSNNFSALISHGKSYSSHDYTRDWLKSIGGFKDRSESIKAIDSDKKASLLFNQGVHFEDRFLSLEIHESMKTGEVQKINEDKRRKDRLHDDVWLTIDNLKLKTIPSVTPPPSRLPPMPRDIPKAVPVKMPDWHAPGNGHARWKAHENGIDKKKQELCASAESDFALNIPVSLACNEADVYRVRSFKEEKSSGMDAVACVVETEKILTSVIPNNLNTKFQAEERLIGTSKSHGRGEQAHLSDVEDKVLKKQQVESLMSATVADHFHGAKQQERKTIAVESVDQMEDEATMSATGTNHLHGIKQAERTTLSVEHKEEEMSIFQVNGVQGTEEEIITDATSNNQVWNSKDDKEGKMVMDATVADHLHGIEQKKRMTLLSEKSEHEEEEVIILAVDGAGCTEEVRKKEESRSSKVNKEITASNMQIENRGVKFQPEADTMKKQTTDREGDHSMRLKEENKRNRPSILEAKERVTQPESAMMEKQTVHRERINEGENKRNNISILEMRGRVTQKGLDIEKKTGNRKGDHSMRVNEEENKRERFSILEEREIVIPPDLVVLEKQTRSTEANSIFRETVKVTQLDLEIIEKRSGQREGGLSMSPNEEEKMMNQSSTLEVRERVTQSKLEMEKQTGYRASDLSMRVNEEENKRKKFSVLEERQKVTQSESETMEKQTRNRGGGNLSMRSNKENTTNKLGILEERVKVTTQSESEIMEEQNGHKKDDSMFEARARVTQPESEIAEKQSRQRDGGVEEENKRIQSSVLEERERMIPTKSKSEIMEKQSRYREGNFSIRQNERIKRNESSKFKARERLTQPESEMMEKQTDHREGDLSMRLNEKGDERNKSSILEVRERVRQPKSEIIEKQIGHGEGCLHMRPDENERNKFSILQGVTQQESEMMVKPTRHGESELCMRLKEEENKRNKSSLLEEKERIIQSESETMETQSRHREGDLSLSQNEENKRNKPSILDTKERATQSESEEMDKHSRHREGGPRMCPSEENKGNKSSSVEAGETVTQTELVHRAGDFSVRLNEEYKRNEPSIFEEKETVTQPELEVLEKQTRHREGDLNLKSIEEEDKKNKPRLSEARERTTQPNSNAEGFEAKHKAAKEIEAVDVDRKVSADKRFLDSLEKKDWGVREIEIDIRRREREYESERQKEREMEREKDRMGLGNTLFDLRERSCEQKANLEKMPVNPRERMGRTPMEMGAAVSRENVLERADKTGAEKVAVSRDKAGLAAAERFHVDTSDRVSERGIAEKVAAEGREQTERAMGIKEQNRKNLNGTGQPSNSSSSFMPKTSNDILRSIRRMSDNRSSLNDGKTHDLRNVASESHRRTLERVAKALAEKKQRDLEVQREFAEKERIAGSIDLELKRWSTGKEGNLRALLSTLHYVLWRESGWQTVSLTEIITSAAVKKVYRKATLCVHPDKVQQKGATIRQKYIAEKVFDLLKEAWNKFNIEEQK